MFEIICRIINLISTSVKFYDYEKKYRYCPLLAIICRSFDTFSSHLDNTTAVVVIGYKDGSEKQIGFLDQMTFGQYFFKVLVSYDCYVIDISNDRQVDY